MTRLRAHGPVSEQVVTALEQRIGIAFPPIYRHLLLETGGGHNAPGTWELRPYNFVFHELWSTDPQDTSGLAFWAENPSLDIPLDWINIGAGTGGNLFVRAVGTDRDSIWLCDTDKLIDVAHDDDPAAFFRVANDINTFMSALVDEP